MARIADITLGKVMGIMLAAGAALVPGKAVSGGILNQQMDTTPTGTMTVDPQTGEWSRQTIIRPETRSGDSNNPHPNDVQSSKEFGKVPQSITTGAPVPSEGAQPEVVNTQRNPLLEALWRKQAEAARKAGEIQKPEVSPDVQKQLDALIERGQEQASEAAGTHVLTGVVQKTLEQAEHQDPQEKLNAVEKVESLIEKAEKERNALSKNDPQRKGRTAALAKAGGMLSDFKDDHKSDLNQAKEEKRMDMPSAQEIAQEAQWVKELPQVIEKNRENLLQKQPQDIKEDLHEIQDRLSINQNIVNANQHDARARGFQDLLDQAKESVSDFLEEYNQQHNTKLKLDMPEASLKTSSHGAAQQNKPIVGQWTKMEAERRASATQIQSLASPARG